MQPASAIQIRILIGIPPVKSWPPVSRFPPDQLAGYTNAITKERLNWLQVKEAATHLSTALVKHYGLKEGETVALFSQNSIWYPVAMHATLRVGGKVSGASPAYNVEEMTYALKTADAKFLMTHPNSMDVAVQAAKNAGIPKKNLFLLEGEMGGGGRGWGLDAGVRTSIVGRAG